MPFTQINPYKGTNPRCWVRLRFRAVDGSLHERELVADTGSPCAVILNQTDLGLLLHAAAAGTNSNFGPLTGAWLELNMPELALTNQILSFGSDHVFQAVQLENPDFAGLVGLLFLRLVEYGGDANWFWIRQAGAAP